MMHLSFEGALGSPLRATPSRVDGDLDPKDDSPWIQEFHDGAPAALEHVYRQCFAHVMASVRRYLTGADAETVAHEVFCRLLSNEALRRNFEGGSLQAWLGRIASNAALDQLRRRRLEQARGDGAHEGSSVGAERSQASCADEVEAKVVVERFRRDCLPPQWAGVFDARFLRQLPQRDAAEELGMRRTTLVYQEQRIRALLRAFLLEEEDS
jgi:RNA polymerase sigma-70 factor, ECF subfamily